MRLRTAALALLATAAQTSHAFVAPSSSGAGRVGVAPPSAFLPRTSLSPGAPPSLSLAAATIFEGEPTERAKSTIDQRQVIRTLPVTSIQGDKVNFDDLIGTPQEGQTSIVVFLRSLG